MTYATDLMLLLLDPQKGRPFDSTRLPLVLGGAVLLELAATDAIRVSGDGEAVKKDRVIPTAIKHDDPILSEGLSALRGHRPMHPQSAVFTVSKNLQSRITAQLKRDREITEERGRVLGIFPVTKWYPRNRSRREELRSELEKVLIRGAEPDQRAAVLISLMSAVDAVPRVFPEADKKAVRKRAKEIAAGDWAAKAVKGAVGSVEAAIIAAVTGASAAAASGY